MTWFDLSSQNWESHHTTKVLFEHGNNDYYDFFNSFNGEGFSLLINLAEGGVMPGGTFITNVSDLFYHHLMQALMIRLSMASLSLCTCLVLKFTDFKTWTSVLINYFYAIVIKTKTILTIT